MRQHRRRILVDVTIDAAAPLSSDIKAKMGFNIEKIFTAAFKPAYSSMCGGLDWFSPVLNRAVKEGRLRYGFEKELLSYTHGGNSYNIKEVSVPVVWSAQTDIDNQSMNQKIAIVRSMLVNVVEAHEWQLCELLKNNDLVLSGIPDCRVCITPVMQLEMENCSFFRTSSICILMPKKGA